jgi:O-antigen/teichoic acid export membrane protein
MSMKRQSLWNMIPLLVSSALGFITMPLVYRYLGEGFAFFQAVQLFGSSFGFMDLGFGTAVGRYIGVALGRGDKEAVRAYWATGNALALPLLAAMTVVFIALGALAGPGWFQFIHTAEDRYLLQWCFVLGGLGMFMSFYTQFWNVVSQAHLDFKFISILRTGANTAQALAAVGVAWMTGSPSLVFAWSVVIGVAQLGVFAWHSRKYYGLGFNFREASRARLHEMAGFTGKTLVGCIVGSLLGRIDQVTVGRLASGLAFPNYPAATNATGRLTNLSLAAAGPVYFHSARAVGSGQRSLGEIFDEMFSIVLDWYCFASTWLLVWSPLVLNLWWGRTTPPGQTETVAHMLAPIFPILVFAFSLSAIACVSASQLGPLNRVGTEVVFVVVSGVMTAACVLIGWRANGLVGVAYGLLVSRVIVVIEDIYVARIVGAKGWFSLKSWRRILLQVALALVFLAIRPNIASSLWASIGLACLHGGLIGSWLAFPYYKRWKQRRESVISEV